MNAGSQFGRVYSLSLVSTATPFLAELQLSELHFTFQITANDVETPNTAYIRVYNVSDDTVQKALTEFDSVVLQVGYRDSTLGVIFKGTIKQFHRGRESSVDSFLEIWAADGDLGFNFGVINTSFPAGTSPGQMLDSFAQSMGLQVDPNAQSFLTGGVILNPRSKAAFGLARVYVRDLAETHNCRWSIQNGFITLIPNDSYLPGEAIVVNSSTGMIGTPIATEEGIKVRMLINPTIKIGQRIQIANRLITSTTIKQQFFPGFKSGATLVARITEDGVYRVLAIDYTGDTRNTDWYGDLTCLSLDPSTPASGSVIQP